MMGKTEKNGLPSLGAKGRDVEKDLDHAYRPSTPELEGQEEGGERANWSRKMDFILSCLSYAVGLGNVWRFPYVCYKNGGGAFLLPFIIMLFITGIPLVFLELSFGQFASSGVISIWSVSPIFQGIGYAMFTVSCLIAIYYNMIIAWTIYYLFASFNTVLPWSRCGDWSSPNCLEDASLKTNCTTHNGTWFQSSCHYAHMYNDSHYATLQSQANESVTRSASDEYFHKVVLEITDGVETMGSLKWDLCLCLLAAWVLVCLCLARGIKSSGKAVYFTAFFPYIVLTILLIRGVTLEGSTNGIIYYLTPKWEALADPKVWKDAAVQIFFSLSPGWGGLITLASYNKFHNNCLLDAILVSILDCLTSVFAGLVIFSIIGYMAFELNKSVADVASDGPGLAFVAYPEVVTKLPVSQLWSVLFFAMLITLGLGTQIATVTTVHTTLLDKFHTYFRGSAKKSFLLLLGIASVGYLVGLSFCTQGGMYVVQIFDNYSATYSLLAIGMVESLALSWVYGVDDLYRDMEMMLGKKPSKIWKYSWQFIAPIALFVILIFTWVSFQSTEYDGYVFPKWADGIGILITLSSILAMPVVAMVKVCLAKKEYRNQSLTQVVKELSKPTQSWGPLKMEHRLLMKAIGNGVSSEVHESQRPMMMSDYSNGKC